MFQETRRRYGTRKIKHELKKLGKTISGRRIGRIMNEQGLVSTYTVAQFKTPFTTCTESSQGNELAEFEQTEEPRVSVSI
ncbi:IS3 family transposase [Peribacillus butanolivorans]|uniref:IS3 family transposase n=1 Tax=Peribacillus butanolivorans TaxID=421767 RepID=UPI003D293E82